MSTENSIDFDYREILLNAFNGRKKRNSSYSLRAFARDIEMSHSRLSEIFSGKGDLSIEKSKVIAKKLKLPPLQAAELKDMVLLAINPDDKLKKAALKRLTSRKPTRNQLDLRDDQFQLIANPMCSALYSCMMLKTFDGSLESLLSVLNLNSIEAYEILRRLQRLGLVRRQDDHWIASEYNITVDQGIPSEWVRSYHREMSILGRKSIDNLPMTVRHLDSLVFPIDVDRFAEIQQKISGFCRTLMNEYCSGLSAVYGLSLQFFPISKSDIS